MYILIRIVHLCTGLILAAGLLMYGVSGLVMTNGDWFPRGKSETTTRELSSVVAARMAPEMTPDEAGTWQPQLADELGLRGRPGKMQQKDNGDWTFDWSRPGTNDQLLVHPGDAAVTLTTATANATGTLNRLHHFHGYAGGPRYFVWGLFVDLASLAMILFPLTGICLWYRLKKDHRAGWLVLGGSTAYGVGSLLYLISGP
ncbi:MAG: PepSY-associated TM helix domain-containing protein [bacterium]|nr:PepSY-associated TM helix domain-containing protein [bacterium]